VLEIVGILEFSEAELELHALANSKSDRSRVSEILDGVVKG
jgi:hypothetical protein